MNLKRGHNIVKWAVIENKIATYFGIFIIKELTFE